MAVTTAEVDGVGIAVVLNERDELLTAARIGRVIVTAKRREDQQGS